MSRTTACLAALAFVAASSAAYAVATGGPGGTWPKSWPTELEPLRKQAWTWQHEFDLIYDIPFASRDEFEAAWPHILKLKARGAPLTLVRGPRLNVGSAKAAGVQIRPAAKHATEGPASVTRIMLVVDGSIVDLNRIRLPGDTPIIDERFKNDDNTSGDTKAPTTGVGSPQAEPRPASGK